MRWLSHIVLGGLGVVASLGCGGSESPTPQRPPPQPVSEGPSAKASPTAVPLFSEVTAAAGLGFVHHNGATGKRYLPETMGSGGCAIDYDGDGLIDLYLVQSGSLVDSAVPGSNQLYRNRGDGTFDNRTGDSGAGDAGYGMGAVCADYDGDGDTDIYVLNVGPNVLLRNDGAGRFEDVTDGAGVGDPRWGSSAVFFDPDRDGDLDLYVVNYLDFSVASHIDCGAVAAGNTAYCHPDAYPMAADVLYLNRGDGTFLDGTELAGLTDTTGKGLGVVAADWNDDGYPDLYVANDSTPNFYYLNIGDGTFTEDGLLWGVSHNEDGKTEAGMGVDAGDVDGDGRLDVFVTNLSLETNSLYLGGADRFSFATRIGGLYEPSYPFTGFGTDLGDFDNDGDLDLVVANGHVIDNVALFSDALTWRQRGQVFLNDGQARYREMSPADAGAIADEVVGRGTITLDYDDDGHLDLVMTANGGPARLLRNTGAASGHWIGFLLDGSGGNREGIGARVTIEAEDRRQLDERKAGSSYQASNDPRLHFGLGTASQVDKLTIRWPDGAMEEHGPLAAGAYYRLRPGSAPTTAPRPPGGS